MALGPVQLLVLGFEHPDFEGEVRKELDRLRNTDVVRVIDALAVYKDAGGEVTTLHDSQLSGEEQAEFGALVATATGGAEDWQAYGSADGAAGVTPPQVS